MSSLSILLINPVTKFTFCSASARCWLDKLLRALLPTFSTLCETDLANFLMFFFSFWPRLMREPPMLPTALLTGRKLVKEWVANTYSVILFPSNLAYMAHIITQSTGKSLSEYLVFASTNPQYNNRLFIELKIQYMKIPNSNLGRTCCVQKLFWMSETISVHNMFSPVLSLEFSCIALVIQWTICRHIVG